MFNNNENKNSFLHTKSVNEQQQSKTAYNKLTYAQIAAANQPKASVNIRASNKISAQTTSSNTLTTRVEQKLKTANSILTYAQIAAAEQPKASASKKIFDTKSTQSIDQGSNSSVKSNTSNTNKASVTETIKVNTPFDFLLDENYFSVTSQYSVRYLQEIENNKSKIDAFYTNVVPSLAYQMYFQNERKKKFICLFRPCISNGISFNYKLNYIQHLICAHHSQIPGGGRFLLPKSTVCFLCGKTFSCFNDYLSHTKFCDHVYLIENDNADDFDDLYELNAYNDVKNINKTTFICSQTNSLQLKSKNECIDSDSRLQKKLKFILDNIKSTSFSSSRYKKLKKQTLNQLKRAAQQMLDDENDSSSSSSESDEKQYNMSTSPQQTSSSSLSNVDMQLEWQKFTPIKSDVNLLLNESPIVISKHNSIKRNLSTHSFAGTIEKKSKEMIGSVFENQKMYFHCENDNNIDLFEYL